MIRQSYTDEFDVELDNIVDAAGNPSEFRVSVTVEAPGNGDQLTLDVLRAIRRGAYEAVDEFDARFEEAVDGETYVCPECRHEHVDEDPDVESAGPSPGDLRITCVECGFTDEQVQSWGDPAMEDPRHCEAGDVDE
jgi:hypothetical protein